MLRDVRRARIFCTATVAVVLALTVASPWLPQAEAARVLIAPAALVGAVAPVLGFRWVSWRAERARDAAPAERPAAYLTAIVVAASLGQFAGLFGTVVAALADDALPLIGVATHVLLVGAIWPTPDRLDGFCGTGVEGR